MEARTSPRNKRKKEEDDNSDTSHHHKRIKNVIVDENKYNEIVAYVKARRSVIVTIQEKLDILLFHARVRLGEFIERQSSTQKKASIDYTQVVSKVLHRKPAVVNQVWRNYVQNEEFTEARKPANYNQKACRVPNCRLVITEIQTFVRENRIKRIRTVARDIVDFLVGKGYMTDVYNTNDDKKSVEAACRNVRRFLNKLGYKRGKKKGMKHYRLKEENVRLRDTYIKDIRDVNAKRVQRQVYLDESYIHKNYCRHEDSLYDPNDEQDLETFAQHKGQRYCFIGAIISADESIPNNQRTERDKAGFMEETLDIFEGGKKQTKDYHGMFDTKYFVNWMKTLLKALDERNVKNCIIVMDNAKYHKSKPDGTPKSNWKKEKLVEACERYGIMYSNNDTKAILWDKLKKHIDENIVPVVCSMASEKGHRVVFSPPHHSDLQPIELVWAIVKGTVGRQYTTDTTFKDVLVRLKKAFAELESSTIEGCIKKSNMHLDNLWSSIEREDALDDEEEDDEEEDDEEEESVEDNNDESDDDYGDDESAD